MDLLGVHHRISKKPAKRSQKGIKVVYISSPLKVETCASQFRALVQELTGKDSNAAASCFTATDDAEQSLKFGHRIAVNDRASRIPLVDTDHGSPTCSDSGFEPFGDVITPNMEGSFVDLFPSGVFSESSQLDMLLPSFV